MSLVEGDHLQAYLERRPSRQERDKLGAHLLELFFYQLLKVGAFHADPHWGNYLFSPNGAIGLVDFGCVKYLAPNLVENFQATFLYPGDRRSAEFRRLLAAGYPLPGSRMGQAALRALVNLADGFYRRVYPPEYQKEKQAFDFGDEVFLGDFMQHAKELFRARGTSPEYVFLARAEAGLYQTLHRLRSRVPTSRIVRKFLPGRHA
jgi:hypothetical protein